MDFMKYANIVFLAVWITWHITWHVTWL